MESDYVAAGGPRKTRTISDVTDTSDCEWPTSPETSKFGSDSEEASPNAAGKKKTDYRGGPGRFLDPGMHEPVQETYFDVHEFEARLVREGRITYTDPTLSRDPNVYWPYPLSHRRPLLNNGTVVPKVPYQDDTKLVLEDSPYDADDYFERKKDIPAPRIRKSLVAFPSDPSRHFVVERGPVELPRKEVVDAFLLAVDENDVLHFRDAERDRDPHDASTWKYKSRNLQSFYALPKNRYKHCVGQTNDKWVPELNELVVVKVFRLNDNYHRTQSSSNYCTEPTYQRAMVTELDSENGIHVELIDDYGHGWVDPVDCMKVAPPFSRFPPQRFSCELAGMELISEYKPIRLTLRDYPIDGIWQTRDLNYFSIQWTGSLSASKNPLVTVEIRDLGRESAKVNLRDHVFRQLKHVMNPFAHLMTREWAFCRVLDINKAGYVQLLFDHDKTIYSRMRKIMDALDLDEDSMLDEISSVEEMKKKGQASRVYLAKMAGIEEDREEEGPTKKYFYRVKVEKFDAQTLTVKCLDHLATRQVKVEDVIPASFVYPEFEHIPPLVYRAHLYPIRKVHLDVATFQQKFSHGIAKVKLLRQWPRSVIPPDVILKEWSPVPEYSSDSDEDESDSENPRTENYGKIKTTGTAAWMIQKGWAEPMSMDALQAYERMIELQAEKIAIEELEEKRKKPECPGSKRDEEIENYLKSIIFMGETFFFSDRDFQGRVSRSASFRTASMKSLKIDA